MTTFLLLLVSSFVLFSMCSVTMLNGLDGTVFRGLLFMPVLLPVALMFVGVWLGVIMGRFYERMPR